MPEQPPHHFDSRLTALETRVDSIGSTLNSVADAVSGVADKLDKSLAGLNEKFETRSRPNWGIMIAGFSAMLTVLAIIGASWKAPIEGTQARQEYDIRKLQDAIVPRETHETMRRQQDRETDDLKKRLDRLESRALAPHP